MPSEGTQTSFLALGGESHAYPLATLLTHPQGTNLLIFQSPLYEELRPNTRVADKFLFNETEGVSWIILYHDNTVGGFPETTGYGAGMHISPQGHMATT